MTQCAFQSEFMKFKIFFKDGSILQAAVLVSADIKIGGLPFDIKTMQKIDDAFFYTSAGSKIYRDQVTGGIEVAIPGVTGPLKISIDQIRDLVVVTS